MRCNRPAAIEHAMPTRRFSRRLRGFVAVCYLLVVTAAGAAPWLADPIAGAVCSTGSGGAAADTLDCPLCLPPQAAAPAAFVLREPVSPVVAAARPPAFSFPARHRPASPPARGPPVA